MALETLLDDVDDRDWDTGPDGVVRVAVVGLGSFGRRVALPALASATYCDPTVVVSGSEDAVAAATDEYGVEGLDYDSYADGAAVDAYDAVYVATPNGRHLPHARTAATNGKAVLCEKPLEATVERAEALVDACSAVPLMTGYRIQTEPVYRRLRSFVRAGGIGTPVAVTGRFTHPMFGGSRTTDDWRFDTELSGGGALILLGVYPLNTARFVLGSEPVAVDGVTRGSGPFEDVDEHVDFHAVFPEAVGSFTASFGARHHTHFGIQGTDGRIDVANAFGPNEHRRVAVETADGRFSVTAGGQEVVEEFDYFGHGVLTGEPFEPDGADGLADVRIVAAVYRAATEGHRVEL